MTTEKFPSEPSMDEILASIRQIISDDSKGQDPSPFHDKNDDILDLTDFLPDEASFAAKNREKKFLSNENKEVQSLSQGESLNLPPLFERKSKRASDAGLDDLLVSPSTASETANTLHSLTQFSQEKKPSPNSPLADGVGSQVIENQLREILRPLLKEWLDANLPLLVRWVVNEQVEKIMRQGRGVPSDLKKET
ncbi:MAG: DUF2497 domain-containing protein [Proteobacteria bacterium]|nr:DUF2497 domain-containing protein [Pseudomonadota bacterium]